jgi:hypothetical protein
LQTHACGHSCDLVFNLDEKAVSEWEEGTSKYVFIPTDTKDRSIPQKGCLTISHLTALTCAAASGGALCPVIVTLPAVPHNIYHGQHRPGNDLIFERNSKPYVDGLLFESFLGHRLIPDMILMKTIPCYSKAEVVLMMGNHSSHVSGEIFGLIGENHVKIVSFAPHTTNVFQALNVPFFSVSKTKEEFWMRQDDDKTLAATIHTLVRQFHSVTTPENIRGNSVRAAFSYKGGVSPYALEFSRERMMGSPRLRQAWELEVPLENLSTSRQNAQFGVMN